MNNDPIICEVEDIPVFQDVQNRVYYTGHGRIDDDGADGNKWGDPDFQPDTSLHHEDGTPLDANTERYIVVPPQIIEATTGIVLGCQGRVTFNGITETAVVADIGPPDKLGEMSSRLAQALGINPNGVDGGVDGAVVLYELWPGIAATVDDVKYPLQRSE